MFWWIVGSLLVIGAMGLLAWWQGRKTEKAIQDIMLPVYPEVAGSLVGNYDFPVPPKTTGCHNPVAPRTARTRVPSTRVWVNPRTGTSQADGDDGLDVGAALMAVVVADAMINAGSPPDDSRNDAPPVYEAPAETSHSWGESHSEPSTSWGESSNSSSYDSGSSSSSDCGSCGGGGD